MRKKTRKFFSGSILLSILLASLINIAPARAAAASLYLTPATGTYVIGDKFTVTVKVSAGGQAINASEGTISFDKAVLDITGVSKSGSIFTLWTAEPSFSKAAGTIQFGGGLQPPGYSGASGKIISITFKAKAVGSAQVRFTSGAVLANDGKGSNILESMGSGNYKVAAKETAPVPETKPEGVTKVTPVVKETIDEEYLKPTITSATHPDQNVWYNKNDVDFAWELPAAVTGLSIAIDKIPTTDPGTVSDGLYSTKSYKGVESGMWYLHLKFYDGKRWGTVDHYRVLIDLVRPKPFDIGVEQTDSAFLPKLFFKTTDDFSGVKQYDVFVNSLEQRKFSLEEDQAQPKLSVQLTDLEYGSHTAMIKALDKAGNETISTVEFTVEPIATPVIKDYSKELKSSDRFFISGTALENIIINIYVEDGSGKVDNKVAHSDKNGNWYYVYDTGLADGRYTAWVEGQNQNGLKSRPSEKVSFLVSPPIFARIGSFVINYFTVIASLLFMIILIVISLLFLIGLIRKKLKKETVEVEEVLHQNMKNLKKLIDEDLDNLNNLKKMSEVAKESEQMKKSLDDYVEATEKKILKEIKDVEDILK
jgi:hypothetical protein